MDWVILARDRDRWRAAIKYVDGNLWALCKVWSFLCSWGTYRFSQSTLFHVVSTCGWKVLVWKAGEKTSFWRLIGVKCFALFVWNYYTNVGVNLEFIAPLCQFCSATKRTEVLYEYCGRIYTAVQWEMEVNVLTVSMNFEPSRLDTRL